MQSGRGPKVMVSYRVLLSSIVSLVVMVLFSASCSGTDEATTSMTSLSASSLEISSTSFSTERPRKRIPIKNTCHGENISPPLDWSGAPDGIASYALIAENIDHETGKWVHWVIYDIPVSATGFPEGISSSTSMLPDGTTQGTNDKKQIGYYGPCPPPLLSPIGGAAGGLFPKLETVEPQRHDFRLYALDVKLGLNPGLTKDELLKAMEGHIVAQAETRGKFMPPKLILDKGGARVFESSNTPVSGEEPTPTPFPSQKY